LGACSDFTPSSDFTFTGCALLWGVIFVEVVATCARAWGFPGRKGGRAAISEAFMQPACSPEVC
jgi:hypothetical protein